MDVFARLALTCLLSLATPLVLGSPNINDYGALAENQKATLSPSGDRLAYRHVKDGKDLLVIHSLKLKKSLAYADMSALMPHEIYFADENNVVLIMSKVTSFAGYRGRYDVSTAFVFDIKTKEIRPLLRPGDNIAYAQTGLGRVIGISPDHKYLYMPALVQNSTHDMNPDLNVMRIDIASPKSPKRVVKGQSDVKDYFLNENGEVLARERYDQHSNMHRLQSRANGKWKTIFERESKIISSIFVAITPDHSNIVMLHENLQTGRDSYSTISLTSGEITPSSFSRDDADVEQVYTDINRIAYGVRYGGLKPSYQFLDKDVNQRLANIVAMFPDDGVWLDSWTDDWSSLLIYVEGATSSGEYFRLNKGDDKPVFLLAARPNIGSKDLHPLGRISIKARDGLVIPNILTIPANKVGAMNNLPAVVMPHGGPESYDRYQFDWIAQALASQGYLVIQPQFRGSAGYGREHLIAGHGEWGRKMQDDITDSLQRLVEKGIVDPKRVCIAGASYGGYSALAGGAFTPDLYQCVVAINGVSQLDKMLLSEKRRYGKYHWILTYFERFMVPGEATEEKLDAVSPADYAQAFKVPVLLVHGEYDETVPFEQSEIMYNELKSNKKDVKLIELEGENHQLMNGNNRQHALASVIDFINLHLVPENVLTKK